MHARSTITNILRVLPVIIFLLATSVFLPAQQFSPFAGDMLSLPITTLREQGYDYRPASPDSIIGQVFFPKLDFLPRHYDENFPGITKKEAFAFLLYATLTIDTPGCYAFSLASDDGSRLWIADSLLIDNDGTHPWRVRRDTHWLETGEHPVSVWYYNAYIPLMGLALKADKSTSEVSCRGELTQLSASALFAFGKSTLRKTGYPELDELARLLTHSPGRRVTITGYTDNVGSPSSNLTLSLARAEAVAAYLRAQLPEGVGQTIHLETIGRGALDPVADNATVAGRQQNRRVTVLIR